MKVARVNARRLPILTGPGGLGGTDQSPPAGLSLDDLTDVDTTGALDGDSLVFEYGLWVPGSPIGAGRWELAVIPGSPPDTLYADGDWLYIFVP